MPSEMDFKAKPDVFSESWERLETFSVAEVKKQIYPLPSHACAHVLLTPCHTASPASIKQPDKFPVISISSVPSSKDFLLVFCFVSFYLYL